MRAFVLALFLAVMPLASLALTVDKPLADGAKEARAKAFFTQIRCVVCEGESIADSPADVAADMRRVIRERIASGDSDQAIRDYLVAQYGNFILMQPPLNAATTLLWFGPLLILIAGALMARGYFRKPVAKAGS